MTDSRSITAEGHYISPGPQVEPPSIEGLPRYERKKIQTRERIYRAALKLFAEKGLAATTVDEIVAVADVAKGTFFNYFHTKEEIFAFFIEIQLAKVAGAVEEARKGERPIRDVLRRAFEGLGAEVGASPNLARALVAAILSNDAACKEVSNGMAEGRRMLGEILSLGQQRGQIRSDRTIRAMGLAFQQALFGAVVLWGIRPQGKLTAGLNAAFTDYWTCIEGRKGKLK